MKLGIVASAHVVPAAPVGPTPLAQWDAGNPASYPGSGTTWFDLSANHYNAAMSGGLVYAPATAGGVMNFTAPTPVAQVPHATPLSLAGSSSVALWINLRSTVESAFLAHGYYTGAGGWMLWWESGQLKVYLQKNIRTNLFLDLSIWQHLVISWTGTQSIIYRNGVQANFANDGTLPADVSAPLLMGTYSAGQYPLDALMNDARLYTPALTATEVSNIFTATRARYGI